MDDWFVDTVIELELGYSLPFDPREPTILVITGTVDEKLEQTMQIVRSYKLAAEKSTDDKILWQGYAKIFSSLAKEYLES